MWRQLQVCLQSSNSSKRRARQHHPLLCLHIAAASALVLVVCLGLTRSGSLGDSRWIHITCLSCQGLAARTPIAKSTQEWATTGGPRALVSVLDESNLNHEAGLGALAKSALRHAPGYFEANHLLVFNHVKYNNSVLEAVRVAGWTVEWLDVPQPFQHAAAQKLWAKTSLWAMTTFTEVVYMEPTTVFVGPITSPFTWHAPQPSDCGVWAARTFSNTAWQDTVLDGAVLGIRPDLKQQERLQSMLLQHMGSVPPSLTATAAVPAPDQLEAVFFNAAFSKASGSWCELELGKNLHANAYAHQRSKWDRVPQLQVVQFVGSPAKDCPVNIQPVCKLWQEEATSNSWPVTLVTAYYTGPNKYKPGTYDQWGRNLMAQKHIPLVIVTDNASAVPSVGLRPPELTHILEVPLEDFLVSQQAYNFWDQQQAINPERGIQSTFLLKIWLEKTNNVIRAIEANPFNSSHYSWVDFGMFRDQSYWGDGWRVHRERFPSPNRMIMLASPQRDTSPKKIGGGIFGGSVRAWQQWSSEFYSRLRLELVKGKRFVGDDQIMMSLIWQSHPHLVCVVLQQPSIKNDPWFYMQDYLAGTAPWEAACPSKQLNHALNASTYSFIHDTPVAEATH